MVVFFFPWFIVKRMMVAMSSSFFFLGLLWKGQWQLSLSCSSHCLRKKRWQQQCRHCFFFLTLLWRGQRQLPSSSFFPCFVTNRTTVVIIVFFSLFEKKRWWQQCHIFLSFLCCEESNSRGVVIFFLPIVTFFLCMLPSIHAIASLQGRGIHVYGFGPLEKVNKLIWLFTNFLFGYVGFQWVKEGNWKRFVVI